MTKTALVRDEVVADPSTVTISRSASLDDILDVLALGPVVAVPLVAQRVASDGIDWARKTSADLLTKCIAAGKKDVGRAARLLIWSGVVLHELAGDATAEEAYEWTQKLLVGKDGSKVLMSLVAQGKSAVVDAVQTKESNAAERRELRQNIAETPTMALGRIDEDMQYVERGVYSASDKAKVERIIARLQASLR